MNYSLRETDLQRVLGRKAHIFTYRDVMKFNNIEELFKYNNKFAVILFETKIYSGHWTLLIKQNGFYEFFDSYGMKPDHQQKYINREFTNKYYSKYPHLVWLLYQSNKPIEYNPYQFQSKRTGVNTCGRWVLLRALLSNLRIDDFKKRIVNSALTHKISLDQLAVNETNKIL